MLLSASQRTWMRNKLHMHSSISVATYKVKSRVEYILAGHHSGIGKEREGAKILLDSCMWQLEEISLRHICCHRRANDGWTMFTDLLSLQPIGYYPLGHLISFKSQWRVEGWSALRQGCAEFRQRWRGSRALQGTLWQQRQVWGQTA